MAGTNARGRAIRRWRKQAGLSQQQLVETLAYDRSMVSGWENGRYPVSNELLAAIAKATGRTLADLEEVLLNEVEEQVLEIGRSFTPSPEKRADACPGAGGARVKMLDVMESDPSIGEKAADARREAVLAMFADACGALASLGMAAREGAESAVIDETTATLAIPLASVPDVARLMDPETQEHMVRDALGDGTAVVRCLISQTGEDGDEVRLTLGLPDEVSRLGKDWHIGPGRALIERGETGGELARARALAWAGAHAAPGGGEENLVCRMGKTPSGRVFRCSLSARPCWIVSSRFPLALHGEIGYMVLSLMCRTPPDKLRITMANPSPSAAAPYPAPSPYFPVRHLMREDEMRAFSARLRREAERRREACSAAGVDNSRDFCEWAREHPQRAADLGFGRGMPHWVVIANLGSLVFPSVNESLFDLVNIIASCGKQCGFAIVVMTEPRVVENIPQSVLDNIPNRLAIGMHGEKASTILLGNAMATAIEPLSFQYGIVNEGGRTELVEIAGSHALSEETLEDCVEYLSAPYMQEVPGIEPDVSDEA